jgi:hypothetical protein
VDSKPHKELTFHRRFGFPDGLGTSEFGAGDEVKLVSRLYRKNSIFGPTPDRLICMTWGELNVIVSYPRE